MRNETEQNITEYRTKMEHTECEKTEQTQRNGTGITKRNRILRNTGQRRSIRNGKGRNDTEQNITILRTTERIYETQLRVLQYLTSKVAKHRRLKCALFL